MLTVPLQEGLAAYQTALLLDLPLRINNDKSSSSGHLKNLIHIFSLEDCKVIY